MKLEKKVVKKREKKLYTYLCYLSKPFKAQQHGCHVKPLAEGGQKMRSILDKD